MECFKKLGYPLDFVLLISNCLTEKLGFSVMYYLAGLKAKFWGQKESFKAILGPTSASVAVIMVAYRGPTPSDDRARSILKS
jgi:hypothetical protein